MQSLGLKVRHIEWRIWRARLRYVALIILLPALVISTASWFWNRRVVVDGLIVENTIVLRAPAPVRVAEVLCRDGDHVRRGDPLVRLEARENQEQRAAVECIVAQRQLRVQLAEQGGALTESDIGLRRDRLEEARSEQARVEADYRVARVDLDRLLKAREARVLALQQERAQREGEIGALGERAREADAISRSAEAEEKLAGDTLQSRAELHRSGLISRLDMQRSESDYVAAEQERQASDAYARALREELEAKDRLDDLARRLEPVTILELDAAIVAQKERVGGLRERCDLWKRIVERREQLAPEEDPGELRELELELLRTELQEAQARLSALDAAIGNIIARAEGDGVIDQVLVAPGNIVEQGATLLTYYDPSSLWGIAYFEPDDAARVTAGQRGLLVLEDLGVELASRVSSISRVWVPCPRLIRCEDDYDMRLPVRVDCVHLEDRSKLWPGARFRLLFPRPFPESSLQ
ncbi:MAG: HlyD family efflux transporter periplasmic adaptor subunit [Planctomycetota bacterium]